MMRIGMIATARDYRQGDALNVMGVTKRDLLHQIRRMGLTWNQLWNGVVRSPGRPRGTPRRHDVAEGSEEGGMLGKSSRKIKW
jgi:hypothetical protein